MKGILRYLASLLAVICLVGAAVLGGLALVTTEGFAREISTAKVTQLQQQRIDDAARALTETWNLQGDLLTPWIEGAAQTQQAAAAKWWGDLWRHEEADMTPPFYLTDGQIGDLTAAVRADAGFAALTDETLRRAIARDEVACAIDEAVGEAVMPLRESVVEIALKLLADAKPLPTLRSLALVGAGVLAGLAVAMLILSRKALGSTLTAAGLMMALLTIPVWLMGIPGMLAQLNDIAALQGRNALICMGIGWYGLAAVLLALGRIILAIKKRMRRYA